MVVIAESAGFEFSANQFLGQSDGFNNNTLEEDYLSFSFPWHGSDMSFFGPDFNISSGLDASQELSSALSFFGGFYSTSGMPVLGGIISTPIQFEISHKEPAKIHFGSGQELEYSKYVSTTSSRNNELWIQGSSQGSIDWSQYVVCPQGSWIQLVAYAPVGGSGGFYEIVQNDTQDLSYRVYQFYPGYNTMSFSADQVGRHILLFIVNNQPSNAVVVDVLPLQALSTPPTSSMPPSEGPMLQNGQTTSSTVLQQQYTFASNVPAAASSISASAPTSGDTPVTIKSNGMRGYDVYVDGVYIGEETSGAGIFGFNVVGDMYHDIRVYDGQFNYPKRIYFQKGVTKVINVEPGTSAYI